MKKPLISIIVPVYNVEAYLEQCIQSVLHQTYENWELILVDDGSPDRCPHICDAWSNKNNKIYVIHKENGGQADARNYGVAHATGEYAFFLDSDDWILPETIEQLYLSLTETEATIAIGGYQRVVDNHCLTVNNPTETEAYTGESALKTMLYQTKFETSACGSIYPMLLVRRFPFPKGKLYEDLFTVYKYLWNSSKVTYLNKPFYCYRVNPSSTMNRSFNFHMFDEIEAVDEIVDFVEKSCPELIPAANSRKFSAYSQVYRWIPQNDTSPKVSATREKLWQFIRSYRFKMVMDGNARLKNRLAAVVSLLGQKIYHSL